MRIAQNVVIGYIEGYLPRHMVRHVRAVGPAVPYWDLVPVTTPTPPPRLVISNPSTHLAASLLY